MIQRAEIKKAYHKLSLIHHPDKQPTSSSGAPPDSTKFQSIQAAYETLSDPKRRAEYDELGDDEDRQPGMGGSGMGMSEEDLFEAMFGGGFGGGMGGMGGPPRGGGGRRKARPQKGPTSRVEMEVTLEELFLGTKEGKARKVEVVRDRKCPSCKG